MDHQDKINEIFESKRVFNKWLNELTDTEVDLIKEMIYEGMQIGFGEGQDSIGNFLSQHY